MRYWQRFGLGFLLLSGFAYVGADTLKAQVGPIIGMMIGIVTFVLSGGRDENDRNRPTVGAKDRR